MCIINLKNSIKTIGGATALLGATTFTSLEAGTHIVSESLYKQQIECPNKIIKKGCSKIVDYTQTRAKMIKEGLAWEGYGKAKVTLDSIDAYNCAKAHGYNPSSLDEAKKYRDISILFDEFKAENTRN